MKKIEKDAVKNATMIITLACLTGCATLTSGPMKRVTINSQPSGAVVRTENGDTKSTPTIMRFPGYKNQIISIEKEGYEPQSLILTKRFQARFWCNLLFWPGAVVDIMTGSAWRLEPKELNINLTKKTSQ